MLRFEALTITLSHLSLARFPNRVSSMMCMRKRLRANRETTDAPIVNATTAIAEMVTSFPYAHTEINIPPFSDTNTSEEATSTEYVRAVLKFHQEASKHSAYCPYRGLGHVSFSHNVACRIPNRAYCNNGHTSIPTSSPTEIVGVA